MKSFLFVNLFCLTITSTFSQKVFQRIYDGNSFDYPTSIVQLKDNIVVAGANASFNQHNYDAFFSVLDTAGNEKMTKLFTKNLDPLTWYSITATSDEKLVVTGNINSGGYLAKIDLSGNIEWQKSLTDYIQCNKVIETKDSGFVIVASNFISSGLFNFIVGKFDVNGNLQWSKTIGDSAVDEHANSVIEDAAGNIIVAGTTNRTTNGMNDFLVTKLSADGELTWARSIGGANDEFGYSLALADNGNYVVAGTTFSFGAGSIDIYLANLNPDGDLISNKTIGGVRTDAAFSIKKTQDGGYVLAGQSGSFGTGNTDFYVVKLNTDLSIQWTRSFGDTHADLGTDIMQATDGTYYFIGTEAPDAFDHIYVARLDAYGNICGNSNTGGITGEGGGTIFSYPVTIADVGVEDTVTSASYTPSAKYHDLCAALPVILVSFSATNNGMTDKLTWTTSNEGNTDKFIIERSPDNKSFIAIGSVFAQNKISNNYIFTDESPIAGDNYYRLKMLDRDGRSLYSETRKLIVSSIVASLYPNPVKNILTIKGLDANFSSTLSIIDVRGNIIESITVKSAEYKWNVQQLASGSYLLQIKTRGSSFVRGFIKQ